MNANSLTIDSCLLTACLKVEVVSLFTPLKKVVYLFPQNEEEETSKRRTGRPATSSSPVRPGAKEEKRNGIESLRKESRRKVKPFDLPFCIRTVRNNVFKVNLSGSGIRPDQKRDSRLSSQNRQDACLLLLLLSCSDLGWGVCQVT